VTRAMSENADRRRELLSYLRCESAAPASLAFGWSLMLEMYLEKLIQEQGTQVKLGKITTEIALTLVQHIRYTVQHFRVVLVTEIVAHPDLADMTVRFSLDEALAWLNTLDRHLEVLSRFGDSLVQCDLPPVVPDKFNSEITPQLAQAFFQRLPDAIQGLKTLLDEIKELTERPNLS
jgi:hypothetical protein